MLQCGPTTEMIKNRLVNKFGKNGNDDGFRRHFPHTKNTGQTFRRFKFFFSEIRVENISRARIYLSSSVSIVERLRVEFGLISLTIGGDRQPRRECVHNIMKIIGVHIHPNNG